MAGKQKQPKGKKKLEPEIATPKKKNKKSPKSPKKRNK